MINLTLSLLLSFSLIFANESEFDKKNLSVDFMSLSPEESLEIEKSLIHATHEVIEGADQEKFLDGWKQNFNFYQKAKDGYRWWSLSQQTPARDLILDGVLLFSLSHSLEVSSGPVLVSIGLSNSWPEWVIGAVGVGGSIVSIPGLDPLCMVIFATYYKSPTTRKIVRQVRVAIVKGISGVSEVTGLKKYLEKTFVQKSMLQRLLQMDALESIKKQGDVHLFRFSDTSLSGATFSFEIAERADREATLRRVEVDQLTRLSDKEAKELQRYLHKLPFSIRSALIEILNAGLKGRAYEQKVYHKTVDWQNGTGVVEFENEAIRSSSGLTLSQPVRTCRELFMGGL